jgi:hypothetical protein
VSILLFCQLAEQDLAMANGQPRSGLDDHPYAQGPLVSPEILRWYGRNRNPYINFQAWMLLAFATMCQHQKGLG